MSISGQLGFDLSLGAPRFIRTMAAVRSPRKRTAVCLFDLGVDGAADCVTRSVCRRGASTVVENPRVPALGRQRFPAPRVVVGRNADVDMECPYCPRGLRTSNLWSNHISMRHRAEHAKNKPKRVVQSAGKSKPGEFALEHDYY
jgi:hypothetical protein